MMIRRRTALLGLAASWTLGRSSLALAAPASRPDEPRFVVVLMRGALDGMAALPPYGDPSLATHRKALLLPEPGQDKGLLDLGGFYGLHPALAGMHDLYATGQFLPIHATAGHYRSRSHFEAQDYLESGADQRMNSGWLNRAVASLPQHGAKPDGFGLAMGLTVPLLLRGSAHVGSYAPAAAQHPDPELYNQIAALNDADPITGPAYRHALKARSFSESVMAPDVAPSTPEQNKHKPDNFTMLATAAGHMLADPQGPRVAALEIGGWDTHAGQVGRLNGPLSQLDRGILALKSSLGPVWDKTVVLVMTEFGRTVRMNGTGGTDHGTGTVTFVAGGPVTGGRVGGTWPGLKASQLFENRDLAPTTDARTIAAGILVEHMGLPHTALAQVFPGTPVPPMEGLVRKV